MSNVKLVLHVGPSCGRADYRVWRKDLLGQSMRMDGHSVVYLYSLDGTTICQQLYCKGAVQK